MADDRRDAAAHLGRALDELGFEGDPEMARTPQLVADLLAEFLPAPLPPCRTLPATSTDLIVLRDLPFYSLCAHHLLPFFGTVSIAVRPSGRIAGLGWYPRLLSSLARRPQLQERLAAQLADQILEDLGPRSVGVRLSCRQLCVEMRGASTTGTFESIVERGETDPAITAALRG